MSINSSPHTTFTHITSHHISFYYTTLTTHLYFNHYPLPITPHTFFFYSQLSEQGNGEDQNGISSSDTRAYTAKEEEEVDDWLRTTLTDSIPDQKVSASSKPRPKTTIRNSAGQEDSRVKGENRL